MYHPSAPPMYQVSPVPWSTGLCDCFSDVPNCCLTCWCPRITFGQVSEIVDQGSSSCFINGAIYTLLALTTGCPFLYIYRYRSKMRRQYMLEEGACGDVMAHFFCESCALCQEYRELKNRGFDVSIGWQGNVDNRTRGVINTPPAFDGGMNRYL